MSGIEVPKVGTHFVAVLEQMSRIRQSSLIGPEKCSPFAGGGVSVMIRVGPSSSGSIVTWTEMLTFALSSAFCAAVFVIIARLLIVRFITVIDSHEDENSQISKAVLPPGPKRLWFFGNLFDIPSTVKWESLRQWQKDFGMQCVFPFERNQ